MKPFILGLEKFVPGSAFLTAEELYDRVGHNTGNLAFHYAIYKQLQITSQAGWGDSVQTIDAAGDLAVVPAANQLGPHADFGGLATKFEEISKKIVMIGLGAQTNLNGEPVPVPEGTLRWVRSVVDKSPQGGKNIAVRGEFTANVLRENGFGDSVEVLGCPSLFINSDPKLGEKIQRDQVKSPKYISVPSGHQNWTWLSKLETSLAHLADVTGGTYIAQSPIEMVQLLRGEAQNLSLESLQKCRDYARPDMELGEFREWARRHGRVFVNVDDWMEHYRRFDLVIGARIHGVMLAIQAGVPGICVVHDGRTLELCETMKVPYILAKDYMNGVSRSDVQKLMDIDWQAFDVRRKELAGKYIKFLQNNGLKPAEYVLDISAN